jgi:hypothetical protein
LLLVLLLLLLLLLARSRLIVDWTNLVVWVEDLLRSRA